MGKGMLVVLEGPDGVGKTPTAYGLMAYAKSHGLQSIYVHHGAGDSTADRVEDDLEIVERYTSTHLVIFDRWWLSTYVYQDTPDLDLPLWRAEAVYGKAADEFGVRILMNPYYELGLSVWRHNASPEDVDLAYTYNLMAGAFRVETGHRVLAGHRAHGSVEN